MLPATAFLKADAEHGVAERTMPTTLFDREREKHALDRLLAAVRQGLSGAFVLRGEAGIGKTALLEYAIESAGDMQVARVTGVES
ncbi:MAG TPA: ATP-binding protein, partial [Solirubrobacteraceae bacterium]|nr:ATP-binding protein [Solirubrobacteraceae bacterium]